MKFESKVIEIIERTHDVKSIRFSRPSIFDYKAGQFMFVNIPSKNGELKKHFTISSSPTETNFLELTKKFTGSDYSNALNALKIGETVKIDAPYGNFVFDEKIKKIAMLSGGIGITPLRSMCKYATDLKMDNNIVLLYGNNTFNDIAYKSEFDRLQIKSKNVKIVHILNKPPSNWKGYKGFINAEIIRTEIPDYKDRIFFICGPPGMVNAMKQLLKEFKLNEKQIKVENFTGY
jgi:ferredoxin-NADP reductase